MEWVLRYQQAEKAAVKAGQLLAEHKPREALAILNGDEMAVALHAFARRITTRGEQGVLATINTKAVYAWQDLRRQAQQAAGEPPSSFAGQGLESRAANPAAALRQLCRCGPTA